MNMSLKLIFITAILVSYSLNTAFTSKHNVEQYTDIQCGYMFNAQIYMRLIEGLLVDKQRLENAVQYNDLSFTKESAQMMATMYNVEAMMLSPTWNVIWIFTVFTERVSVYMKTFMQDGQVENQKAIVSVHKSVSLLLQHYMATKDCEEFREHNKLDDEVTGNLDDLQSLLSMLESKKTTHQQDIDTRAKELNLSTDGYEQFSLNTLGLKGLLANTEKQDSFYKIINISQIEISRKSGWDLVFNNLKKVYDLETHSNSSTLSQQIESLATFNDKFLSLAKLIMVRLMLKFLEYVKKKGINWGNKVKLVERMTEMFLEFDKLENHLNIPGNKDVKRGRDKLDSVIRKGIACSLFIGSAINSIKDNLNQFSLHLYGVDFWRSFNVEEITEKSITTLCEDIKNNTKSFVEALLVALADINFSVITTFRLIVRSDEYKKLVDFEKSVRLQ